MISWKLVLRAVVVGLQLVAFTGCAGAESTFVLATQTAWSTQTPLATVRTVVPAPTSSVPADAYPVAPEPTRPDQAGAYPYPAVESEFTLLGMTAAPFRDCAMTPGLAGCSDQAPPVSGRLAFTDQSVPRVVTLDLVSGKGWQVPFHPEAMDWAPSGNMLLMRHDTEGGFQYQLWSSTGDRLADPQGDALQHWQWPAILAAQDTLIAAAERSEYRLELAAGPRWVLHAQVGGGDERALVIDAQPADKQYLLLDRARGSARLLAQTYFPTNLGPASGGEMILIDPVTGKLQPLGISAPLGSAASLAWSPAKNALGAFLSSGGEPMLTSLTLFDFSELKRSDPLPPGVQVSALAWSPDGEKLAFAAEPLPGVISLADQQDYPAAGLYLLDPASGAVELALQFPVGAGEGWVGWTKEPQVLLYAAVLRNAQGTASVEVHAYDLEARRDALLVNPLPLAGGVRARIDWRSILAFAP